MTKQLQPVIKWGGSKRHLSNEIVNTFPDEIRTYYEPFIGGGSVLGNMLKHGHNIQNYVASDICEPLIGLWKTIQSEPCLLIKTYTESWKKLKTDGNSVYYEIREHFNQTHQPSDFLFLSRTCMNGLIRFNQRGDFNSSFHLTRPGINPEHLTQIIHEWSSLIANVKFVCADYIEATKDATTNDIIYLDPPYASTKGMYDGTFDQKRLFAYLKNLNERNVRWVLSYDGKRGDTDMTAPVPCDLYTRHMYLNSGCSSFSRIKKQGIVNVKESLYLNW